MIGWIIKMLLKVLKPFAKIAILEAILGSLDTFLEEEETEEDVSDGE